MLDEYKCNPRYAFCDNYKSNPKYINNATGEWCGPRDDDGDPVYESPVTITITDANGIAFEEWTVTGVHDLIGVEEMHKAIMNPRQ